MFTTKSLNGHIIADDIMPAIFCAMHLMTDVTKTGNGERGTGSGERGAGNGERK